jgi:hypothetical protein
MSFPLLNIGLGLKLKTLRDIIEASEEVPMSPFNRWDARRSRRRSSASIAYVKSPTLGDQLECRLLNMSATGACIEPLLNDATNIDFSVYPYEMVIVWPTERLQAKCTIVWQQKDRVGLRYLTLLKTMTEQQAQGLSAAGQCPSS